MVEVSPHDETLPSDSEAMKPTRKVRVSAGPVPDVEAVFRLLSSPHELPRLHPLIGKIEVQSSVRDGSREVFDFTIDEHVPMLGGLVKVPNRYRGRIVRDDSRPGVLRLSGWSSPGVRIEIRYDITPAQVTETLWLGAPWWIEPFVFSTALKAHQRTLEAVLALSQRP